MKLYLKVAIAILLPSFTFAQHKLTLKSGEAMNGKVAGIKDETLSFVFKGNVMTFPLSEVKAILFEDLASQSNPATKTSTTSGTKGVNYVMAGRKMTKQPVINNLTMEKGIVVVEITINKYGNVIKAEPGGEGTTTTSQYLLTKAKQAAESVQFDTNPVMPLEQKGTITITF